MLCCEFESLRMAAKTFHTSVVWPDVGLKSSPNYLKVVQKVSTAFLLQVSSSKIPPKVSIFGLFLQENLLPRTFKNRPIWSQYLKVIEEWLWHQKPHRLEAGIMSINSHIIDHNKLVALSCWRTVSRFREKQI